MSLCLMLQTHGAVMMAADTALTLDQNGTTQRISNDGKKLFQFGNEVMFCSGYTDYVNRLIPKVEMSGKRINRVKLHEELDRMIPKEIRPKPESKDEVHLCIAIAGVVNGESYVYTMEEENDFKEVINTEKDGGFAIQTKGYKSDECFELAPKILTAIGCCNDFFFISLFKSVACEEVGGKIDVFNIEPGKTEQVMKACELHDGYAVHKIEESKKEKVEPQLRELLNLPVIHAVMIATKLNATEEGQIACWNFDNNAIWKDNADFGQSGGMYFGKKGLSIGNALVADTSGSVSVTGSVNATKLDATKEGKIACWNFDKAAMWRGNSNFGDSGSMYFGEKGLSIGNAFTANVSGNVSMTGSVNATNMTAKEKYKLYLGSVEDTIIQASNTDSRLYPAYDIGLPAKGTYIRFRRDDLTGAGGDIEVKSDGAISVESYNGISVFTDLITAKNIRIDRSKHLNCYLPDTMQTINLLYISSESNIWLGDHRDPENPKLFKPMNNAYISANNVYSYGSGGKTELSDERYKYDIKDIPKAKDFIMGLSPKIYKFTDGTSNRLHAGFLAGDVKKTMDSTVGDFGVYVRYTFDEGIPIDEKNPDTYMSGLRYSELIAPHIAVTQEHEIEISRLKKKVEELEQELLRLTHPD